MYVRRSVRVVGHPEITDMTTVLRAVYQIVISVLQVIRQPSQCPEGGLADSVDA